MWTVLLVEDEIFVRESIRATIEWESLGFTVIGEAGNGDEALSFIREHRPDLVISDIIMPKMDGVELLRQTRELGLDCRFLMLSCMSDFEYVRQAMEYGASNYILKLSMSVNALKEALLKMDRELAKLQSRRSDSYVYERYERIWELLLHPETPETEGADAAVHEVVSFPHPAKYVALVSALHGGAPFTREDFIRMHLVDMGAGDSLHSFSRWGQTTFFYWSSAPVHIRANRAKPGRTAIAYMSSVRNTELLSAWRTVLKKLDAFWYEGGHGMLQADHAPVDPFPVCFGWKQERQFIQEFEEQRLEACRGIIKEAWDAMRDRRVPMYAVKDTAFRISSMLQRMLDKYPSDTEAIGQCLTHNEARDLMLQLVEQSMASKIHQTEEYTDHDEVNKIIAYINQHYDQDLTVKFLAQHVALDENYLSTLFKKKTGNSLIHYIQSVRIEKAKTYLENTDWPVSEIGVKVGFVNDSYFIKIFKRWTQVTPTQYRKIVADESM
jgi:two-component system response regulator YesN